jgi:hypothetical protein
MNGPWVGPFQNCVRQPCPPFKMAAVTKNRNFFNCLIWFSGFKGEDLNVIFDKNMPNLHNRHKLAERKISQKNPEYMLNYSLPCSCS